MEIAGVRRHRTALCAILVLILGSCSLQPLVDGTYLSEPPDYGKLGFFPKGDNLAPNASVTIAPAYDEFGVELAAENTLELNLGYLENNPSKGTWRDFALWAGWVKTALNDSITTVGEPGTPGNSSGWCSFGADPATNVPTWIQYDFGREVEFQSFGMWPRDDAGVGRSSNMPRVYYAQWSNDGASWVKITGSVSDGWDDALGMYTHDDGWPNNFDEQFHYFDTSVSARYFRLVIEDAGDSFAQLAELAVYAK